MRYRLVFTIIAVCAAVSARADTAAYMAQQLAHYQKYAGAPVEDFPIVELWQWQVVGKEKLVLWSAINKAYLITVDKPCPRLEWTRALSITQNSSMHLTRRFDTVNFEHQRCHIAEIRPIDYKALRADEKATEAAKAAAK